MDSRPAHTETTALAATQPVAADYARERTHGLAWLRFQPRLEAEFRQFHVLRVRAQARFWQVLQLLIGLVSLRIVLGIAEGPQVPSILLACAAIHLALSVALVAATFSRAYARSYLGIAAVLTPFRIAAFAVIVAAVIAKGGGGAAAMTINMFGLLFFSGLMLRQALPAALVMIATFAAALAAFDVHTVLAAYSVTSLLVVSGLAGFVAWDTQRAARMAFLEHGITRVDAARDALTGLANRRHFDARLEAMWKAAGSRGLALTVMLVDVDHFKAYNDHYGHQAGDEALRSVARSLSEAAGKGAVVARFGGEEMAVLAAMLGEHEAEALAGRLRRAVEALAIPHAGAPGQGNLSVSIGGACIVPLPGRSATGALQLADQNLYAAKREGRNRVVFHHDQYAMMQTGAFRHGAPEKAP